MREAAKEDAKGVEKVVVKVDVKVEEMVLEATEVFVVIDLLAVEVQLHHVAEITPLEEKTTDVTETMIDGTDHLEVVAPTIETAKEIVNATVVEIETKRWVLVIVMINVKRKQMAIERVSIPPPHPRHYLIQYY